MTIIYKTFAKKQTVMLPGNNIDKNLQISGLHERRRCFAEELT